MKQVSCRLQIGDFSDLTFIVETNLSVGLFLEDFLFGGEGGGMGGGVGIEKDTEEAAVLLYAEKVFSGL